MQNYHEQRLFSTDTFTVPFHRVLDVVSDVIFVLDTGGRFVYVNQVSLPALGYHPCEMIGQAFESFVLPQDKGVTARSFQRIINGYPATHLEIRCIRKDGSAANVLWSGQGDGENQLVYCVLRSATEKKENERLQTRFEQEVRRNNGERQNMLERITDGYFTMDQEWRITDINKQVEAMLSLQREEYLFKNYWECFPEMVGSVYYDQYHKAQRENVPVQFEAYFPPFQKWLSVNAYPSEEGLTVFFQDVTERRAVEEELRNLSLIAKETINVVLITSPDGVITWANEALTRVTGYTIDEAIGKTPRELFDGPETDPETIRYMLEQREKGATFQVEILNYTRSGEKIWSEVFAQPVFDAEGNLQQYFFIGTDITGRRKAEEELRNLSRIVKENQNMVSITDIDGRITWVNDAFLGKTGFTYGEVIGQKLSYLLDGPETDPEIIRGMEEQMAKGAMFNKEIVRYTKHKQKLWLDVYGQAVRDAQGKVYRFFVVQTDISERKRLQERLDEEMRKRQQLITAAVIKAQEKERSLISSELHDNVNQLLTSAKLYAAMGRDGGASGKEMMEKTITLLQDAIDEIRCLSKRLSVSFVTKTALEDSIQELVEMFSATNQLEITFEMELATSSCASDDVNLAVYRILQEHLTNVTKHAQATRVDITLRQREDWLRVVVVDNGTGFDTRMKAEGIGLANMRSRAESLMGHFNMESQPGKGCTLNVQLPLTR